MSDRETGSREYLLALAIGPVQEFIAAGRKTRDLWAGSAMLSEIAAAVAGWLNARDDVTLIFPAPAALTSEVGAAPAVANKMLARVHAPADTIAGIANDARKVAQTTLEERWDETWKGIKDPPIDLELAAAQVRGFLEWYAAWVPFDPDAATGAANGYPHRRGDVDLSLAGRKALRDFRPANGRDGIPKSALDPAWESVIRLAGLDDQHEDRARRQLRLKGAEQLDAVSLIKRRGTDTRFVSVSRVAVDPYIRAAAPGHAEVLSKLRELAGKLDEADLAERFPETEQSGLDHFADFPFDCQLFYAPPAAATGNGGDPLEHWLVERQLPIREDPVQAESERAAAVDFIRLVQGLSSDLGARPPAYFAVLVADGDRMGKAIGQLQTIEAHQRFSTELARFAGNAKDIVKSHFGALVYSGGDDVLAFLPLDTALPCAATLAKAFEQTMKDALPSLDAEARPTLSAGVAIGHYAEHLAVLLKRAGEAERAAKDSGRNALAVSFTAHSGGGETRTVVHSWTPVDPVHQRWRPAIELHRQELFPDKGAYELDALRRELRDLSSPPANNPAAAKTLLVPEVQRILLRKRAKRGTEEIQKTLVDEITRRLEDADDGLAELQKLVGELLIARRIEPVVRLGGDDVQAMWGLEAMPAGGTHAEAGQQEGDE